MWKNQYLKNKTQILSYISCSFSVLVICLVSFLILLCFEFGRVSASEILYITKSNAESLKFISFLSILKFFVIPFLFLSIIYYLIYKKASHFFGLFFSFFVFLTSLTFFALRIDFTDFNAHSKCTIFKEDPSNICLTNFANLKNEYHSINSLFNDVLEANSSHNLLTVVFQSGKSTGLFNQETILLANNLNLKQLALKINKKCDDCAYIGMSSSELSYDLNSNNAFVFYKKIKGHQVRGFSAYYPGNNDLISSVSIDDYNLNDIVEGVNVVVYNLTTNTIEGIYNFAPKS